MVVNDIPGVDASTYDRVLRAANAVRELALPLRPSFVVSDVHRIIQP